jgi:hypothetical protein
VARERLEDRRDRAAVDALAREGAVEINDVKMPGTRRGEVGRCSAGSSR